MYDYSKYRKVENVKVQIIEQQKIVCSPNERWLSQDLVGYWVHEVFDSKAGLRFWCRPGCVTVFTIGDLCRKMRLRREFRCTTAGPQVSMQVAD